MEGRELKVIHNRDDLAKYERELYLAKSSLLILLLPYLKVREPYASMRSNVTGVPLDLLDLIGFYSLLSARVSCKRGSIPCIMDALMDRTIRNKIELCSEALSQDLKIKVTGGGIDSRVDLIFINTFGSETRVTRVTRVTKQ